MKRLVIKDMYVDGTLKDCTIASAIVCHLDGNDGDRGQLETITQALETTREALGELVEALVTADLLPRSFVKNLVGVEVVEIDYQEFFATHGYVLMTADDPYTSATWLIKPDGVPLRWCDTGLYPEHPEDTRVYYLHNEMNAYNQLRRMLWKRELEQP